MAVHRKLAGLFTGLLLYVLTTGAAQAQLITEFVNFNMTSVTSGLVNGHSTMPATPSLMPFDSTLGQLDAVEVSITGNAILTMTTGMNYYIDGYGNMIFRPYSIYTTLGLGFDGLTDYFHTSPDLGGLLINTVPGTGGGAANAAAYSLGFRIDPASELLGSYLPPDTVGFGGSLTSYPLVYGARNDFLDSQILSDLLLFTLDVDFLTVGPPPMTPTIITANSFGLMQVDYYYTPFAELVDPSQQVPEPAVFWLFATGLVLLGFASYRKSTVMPC